MTNIFLSIIISAIVLCVFAIIVIGAILYSKQRDKLKPLTHKSIQKILDDNCFSNEYNAIHKTIVLNIPAYNFEIDCNVLPYAIFVRLYFGIAEEERHLSDLLEAAAATMSHELSMVKANVKEDSIQFYIAAPERNYANLEQNMEFYFQQLIKASQRCRELFDTLKDEISKTACNE